MDVFRLIEMSYACTKSDESAVVTEYDWGPIVGHQVTWKFNSDLSQQAVLIDYASFAEFIDDLPIARIECDRYKCIIYLNETDITFSITEHVKALQQANDDEEMTFNFDYDDLLHRIYVT